MLQLELQPAQAIRVAGASCSAQLSHSHLASLPTNISPEFESMSASEERNFHFTKCTAGFELEFRENLETQKGGKYFDELKTNVFKGKQNFCAELNPPVACVSLKENH